MGEFCDSVNLRQHQPDEGAWAQSQSVFSDAREPGEGEHKIMRVIRDQRLQPSYDPNTHHMVSGGCLCYFMIVYRLQLSIIWCCSLLCALFAACSQIFVQVA